MKLTTLIILIGFMYVSAATYGQRVNINAHDITIDKLFKELKKQTGYSFLYKSGILKDLQTINVDITDATITEVLDKFLKDRPLDYLIVDKSIVIRRKANAPVKENGPMLFVGRVLNEDKKPLPGVTIKVKGAQVGQTYTNEKGEFSILVINDDDILQFSYVGYESLELKVKGLKNPLSITLKAATNTLDQVQVLAYGSTTRRLSTGSIVQISSQEIEKNPVPNVLQALQGHVPGVFIQQNTGLPGGSFGVAVRAGSSISGGTVAQPAPLYIVDGVAYPAGQNLPLIFQGSVNGANLGPLRGGNALNYLNSNEIESVTVLKDADATSIYGSRGAYGVILIKTKKGIAGPPQVNLNVYSGVTLRGTSPDLLNTDQYLMIRREAFKNDNATPGVNDLDLNGTWPTNRYTNLVNELTGGSAATTNANLSYSGGSNNTNYRISGDFSSQNSIQKHGGDVKNGGLTIDLNSTSNNKKFNIDVKTTFSSDVNTLIPFDFNNGTGPLSYGGSGLFTAPNAPSLFLPDGSLNWETGSNPASAIYSLSKIVTNNLLSTVALSYKPVKGLSINATGGYNLLTGKEFNASPSTVFSPDLGNLAPYTYSIINNYSTRTWDFDANADYQTHLGSKGELDVRVGGTTQDVLSYSSIIRGSNYASDALIYDPAAGGNPVLASYSQTPIRYIGFFGHLNYIWDQKYILNLNTRYDGSTKFGPGKRFGTFGSIGAGWIFSQESLFKNLKFLDFGKIRASYGTVGGDNIGNYNFLSYYSNTTAYQGNSAVTPTTLSNPELHWELKKELGIGLDLNFLHDRITFTGDYYRTRTTNQLIGQALPTITGFSVYTINSPALIQTTGFELSLTTVNVKSKNFTWSTNFNISIPHSKLISYPGLNLLALNSNYIIGKPVTGVKLYNYAGVNPQTGNYNFTNRNGVTAEYWPIFSPAKLDQILDKTAFVDLAPKYYGGFGNTFQYKNFSLDVFFDFKSRMGQNFRGSQSFLPGYFNINTGVEALNRWQKPGDITNVPKVSQNGLVNLFEQGTFDQSSGAYTKVTYARLNNLNFTYRFPSLVAKKLGLNNLSVFLRGQNLLTISNIKYKGLDPENLTIGATPPLRVFTAGLNVTL
ncbi:SusC/RagA family TonB-linked outer membrane protein [Mucilaginibacter sp. OK098]|uniref:SusC/RagA family TonB-linked outer membrane protein n=1 Tax=Mucilaginibacter sp. OK098 TaxID=1855297 RepID=UPI0013564EE4|nr:SusC/RagA family TonB-linked outer membrane protein [Mucilaginibacter sp. OK098]